MTSVYTLLSIDSFTYILAFHIVSVSDILLLIQSVLTQRVKIRMGMAVRMAVTTVYTPNPKAGE